MNTPEIKLFYSPGACSLASHIVLEETGAPFEPVRVALAEGAQRRPEYLAINPKGRVPALLTDKGILTENIAILAYIAQIAPAARLAPLDDPFEFAQMQAFNSYLSSTVHVNHSHKGRGARWTDASGKRGPQGVTYDMLLQGNVAPLWKVSCAVQG